MTGSNIGKTIYIATAAPATNDTTGFEALSWTKINGVQTLPQFGVSHSNIDVPDLQTGVTSGLKGAASGNDTTMTFRDVASDTGQGSVLTESEDAAGIVSLKIGKGSGAAQALQTGDAVEYAQGYLHGYTKIEGTDTTHEGFSVNFKQNDFAVTGTEPA